MFIVGVGITQPAVGFAGNTNVELEVPSRRTPESQLGLGAVGSAQSGEVYLDGPLQRLALEQVLSR